MQKGWVQLSVTPLRLLEVLAINPEQSLNQVFTINRGIAGVPLKDRKSDGAEQAQAL